MSLPPVMAALHAGPIETHYHRAGHGPALLLLFAQGLDDPLGAALFHGLSAHFRVILPMVPAAVQGAATPGGAPVPASRWVRDLVDGLGLDRPGVVADEPFAGAVLAVMLAAPGRVGGAVAIGRDHAAAVEAIEDHLDHSGRALAVILVDDTLDVAASGAEAVPRIVAILAPAR